MNKQIPLGLIGMFLLFLCHASHYIVLPANRLWEHRNHHRLGSERKEWDESEDEGRDEGRDEGEDEGRDEGRD